MDASAQAAARIDDAARGMLSLLRGYLGEAAHGEQGWEVLDDALGLYQHIGSLIAAMQDIQTECKELVGEVFVELGVSEASMQSGRCYVTRPSCRVTYDAKGLDALAANDDELAILLAPYRRQTEVAGTLTIRAASEAAQRPKPVAATHSDASFF